MCDTADEGDDDTAISPAVSGAPSLAGAWADLDWEDAVAALDHIRHASELAPPIETF